jgi:hypothetical protein
LLRTAADGALEDSGVAHDVCNPFVLGVRYALRLCGHDAGVDLQKVIDEMCLSQSGP